MSHDEAEIVRDIRRWWEAVLANDETSTDAELVAYFQDEGGMTKQAAENLVSMRKDYLRGRAHA